MGPDSRYTQIYIFNDDFEELKKILWNIVRCLQPGEHLMLQKLLR
jgi:hypothetical protein